jgi:hypothetical protein
MVDDHFSGGVPLLLPTRKSLYSWVYDMSILAKYSYERVASKVLHPNKLAPEGNYLPAGLDLFFSTVLSIAD